MIRPGSAYPTVHHAGRWTAWEDAVLHTASITARYAVSLFEGVRAYRQNAGGRAVPFLPVPHLDRLRRSLALTAVPDPGLDRLPAIIAELIERNGIEDDAYLRIAVNAANFGGITDEVEPQLTVTAARMGRKRWLAEGAAMALTTGPWERADARAFPAAAKNISQYAGARLAELAARKAGFDGCLLVNRAGRVTEAPTATLFLASGGVLVTPSLDEGVLPGITRQWVLDHVAGLGLRAEERPLAPEELGEADEAFLCGTGIEFAPVRSFDKRECSRWEQRPAISAVVEEYFRQVRGHPVPEPAVAP